MPRETKHETVAVLMLLRTPKVFTSNDVQAEIIRVLNSCSSSTLSRVLRRLSRSKEVLCLPRLSYGGYCFVYRDHVKFNTLYIVDNTYVLEEPKNKPYYKLTYHE